MLSHPNALWFDERIGLLVDREAAERETKGSCRAAPDRLCGNCRFASPRGNGRAVCQADCRRLIDRDENLLVTGATGPGKLACLWGAATRPAAPICRCSIVGCPVVRGARLARDDGRYSRLLNRLGACTPHPRSTAMAARPKLVTSQIPVYVEPPKGS